MAEPPFPPVPDKLPVPIWLTQTKYLIFDADHAAYLRAIHHICGVAVGTLPQVPQQNVFSGLPLQLMPEEALLLVEKGVAKVMDNASLHLLAVQGDGNTEAKRAYRAALRKEGLGAAAAMAKQAEERRKLGMAKQAANVKKRIKSAAKSGADPGSREDADVPAHVEDDGGSPTTALFEDPIATRINRSTSMASSTASSMCCVEPFHTTPTTSTALLGDFSSECGQSLPVPRPASYPLFRHLHDRGYYLSPGLRFGCQYLVYPGDPLRFHSHFAAVHRDGDEDFNLLDVVTGGRLGTGVKKAFMMGGVVKRVGDQTRYRRDADGAALEADGESADDGDGEGEPDSEVRCFSIEWAGM